MENETSYHDLAGKTAWVLDDFAVFRDDIADTLGRVGMKSRLFEDPLEPMRLLREIAAGRSIEHKPDIIITDYDFTSRHLQGEGMTPEPMFDIMQRDPVLRRIPITLCTGEDTIKYKSWPPLNVQVMGKAKDDPASLVRIINQQLLTVPGRN